MKNLAQRYRFQPMRWWFLIVGLAFFTQTTQGQESYSYCDDRYSKSQYFTKYFNKESYVKAIAVTDSGDLFIAGNFGRVLKWNGTDWSPINSVNFSVEALAIMGDDLYVGGYFNNADTISANNIVKYSLVTKTWSALEMNGYNGVNARVLTLTANKDELYVGGIFTTAGGLEVNHIAKWKPVSKTWTALGRGVDDKVKAIAVQNNEVYVGGQFKFAGGIAANHIAKWNGQEWSALGHGVSSEVRALAVWGNAVYVGGSFATAGGVEAKGLAKWNTVAQNWSAFGSAGSVFNHYINALACDGRDLYIVGSFAVNRGSNFYYSNVKIDLKKDCWSLLGCGDASSFKIHRNVVYYGGGSSKFFAAWHKPPADINRDPVWSSLPDVTFPEDDSLNLSLSQSIKDFDHTRHDLAFHAKVIGVKNSSGNTGSLSGQRLKLRFIKIGPSPTVIAILTAAKDAHGIYTVAFTATDPCGNSASDTVRVTVTPVNDPPVIAALPPISFKEDKWPLYSIRRWYPFVTDKDNPDSALTITFGSGKHITAIRQDRHYRFKPASNWFGKDTLQFIVNDFGQLADTAAIIFNITPVNDPPKFIKLPQTLSFKMKGSSQLKIWPFLKDVETPAAKLSYEFAVNNDSLQWNFNAATGTLVLTAPNFHGLANLFVTARDDSNAAARDTISVRVEKFQLSSVVTERNEAIPAEFFLQQNYPNPFNPTTLIRFGLPQETEVKLEVLNLNGQLVATLLNARQAAGYHEVLFDAAHLPSGNYFTVLQAGEAKLVRRIVLMK